MDNENELPTEQGQAGLEHYVRVEQGTDDEGARYVRIVCSQGAEQEHGALFQAMIEITYKTMLATLRNVLGSPRASDELLKLS